MEAFYAFSFIRWPVTASALVSWMYIFLKFTPMQYTEAVEGAPSRLVPVPERMQIVGAYLLVLGILFVWLSRSSKVQRIVVRPSKIADFPADYFKQGGSVLLALGVFALVGGVLA